MTFISPTYGLFFISVLVIYWLGRSPSMRLGILLIASLVFYGSLQWTYIPLLLVTTLINFRLGRAIAAATIMEGVQAGDSKLSEKTWQHSLGFWNQRRRSLLGLGIVLNVALLFAFKYVAFSLNSIATLLHLPFLQENATWVSNTLIAPLGLSFFIFECIAYLVDVYRGAPATQQFLKFSAYKLFFPKLISGPITRYHYFAIQLKTLQFPDPQEITEGLWLIACGAVKKALIADPFGRVVDLSFSNLERAGSGDLWLATIAYGLQLYLDFSGYVDMARGSAMLLGFNLPQNFDFPYFTTSIAEFWRRWHITLGDWLRNYLYFPLGGSRQGLTRTCFNLGFIMLVAGIWHGAAWGFIVWGILHGSALVVHRLNDAIAQRFSWIDAVWKSLPGILVAWLLTQLMVFTSWIFFRLPDLNQAGWVVTHLWGHPADIQFAQKVYLESLGLERSHLALIVAVVVGLMAIAYTIHRGLKLQLNWPLKLLLVPLCFYAVWLLAPQGGLPYIYFDF